MAAGFAELQNVSKGYMLLGSMGQTYLSTIGIDVASIAASSLSRCGRFPVFSSCSITPTTISSLIPSVSTFVCPDSPSGDGGGVSATRPAGFGCSLLNRKDEGRGGVVGVETFEVAECDRLTFFEGGWCSPETEAEEGGEGRCDDDRELFGSWIPSDGSDSDLRRVL